MAENSLNQIDWQCFWNEKNITEKIKPLLAHFTLDEKRGEEADELRLELIDTFGDLPLPKKGDEITLKFGFAENLIEKGRFLVDEFTISGPPDKISICAKSASFLKQNHIRRAQSFKNQTLGVILRQIAARMDLTAKIDPIFENLQIIGLLKIAKSDLAILKELGKKFDALASIKNNCLIFSPVAGNIIPSGKIIPIFTIDRKNAPSFSFSQTARDDENGVESTYYDRREAKQKKIVHGKNGLIQIPPQKIRKIFPNEEAAEAHAKSARANRARSINKLSLDLAIPMPDIFPNAKIRLENYRNEINEINWVVEKITHSMGARGLSTKLELESA